MFGGVNEYWLISRHRKDMYAEFLKTVHDSSRIVSLEKALTSELNGVKIGSFEEIESLYEAQEGDILFTKKFSSTKEIILHLFRGGKWIEKSSIDIADIRTYSNFIDKNKELYWGSLENAGEEVDLVGFSYNGKRISMHTENRSKGVFEVDAISENEINTITVVMHQISFSTGLSQHIVPMILSFLSGQYNFAISFI